MSLINPPDADSDASRLQIGILTKGKPTLAMALSSLLLQEDQNIIIHVVDTAEKPVIKHDDFASALRLAFDRNIPCTYEHNRDRTRPFSSGRRMLLEALSGPNVCFMDDDVVVPGGWLRELTLLMKQNPDYGFLAPVIKNAAGGRRAALGARVQFAPGSLFHQDKVVRAILLDYYDHTIDVLDRQRGKNRVWEIAFMTELFALLGRPSQVQTNSLVYHLDYHERPNWELLDDELVRASREMAAELVQKHAGFTPVLTPLPVAAPH